MNCQLCGKDKAIKTRPYIYDSGIITYDHICLKCEETYQQLTKRG
jgi:hypothetical protein